MEGSALRLTSCGGPESTHFGTPVSFKVRIIPKKKNRMNKLRSLIALTRSHRQEAHSLLNWLLFLLALIPELTGNRRRADLGLARGSRDAYSGLDIRMRHLGGKNPPSQRTAPILHPGRVLTSSESQSWGMRRVQPLLLPTCSTMLQNVAAKQSRSF